MIAAPTIEIGRATLATSAAQSGTHDRDLALAALDALAGKALATFLYNIGAHSLEETQGAFDRHPQWTFA